MSDSIYRKVLSENMKSGDIKRQIIVDLSPWEIKADESTNQPAMSGYTCQLKVVRFGFKPKTSYINFDPLNKDIREALAEMYAEADKLKK